MKMKHSGKITGFILGTVACLSIISCDENKSYSELLESERKAVNWYLSNFRVDPQIPSDSVFMEGEDAPFYRMDVDGNVYMRVINKGDMTDRPKKGDQVYFLFMRTDINNLYKIHSLTGPSTGNADDMNSSISGTSLIFGNQTLPSTTQYGEGLQIPLNYLGYNCEVDLVVKSVVGFSGDMSDCIAYVFNIRYFKAEY